MQKSIEALKVALAESQGGLSQSQISEVIRQAEALNRVWASRVQGTIEAGASMGLWVAGPNLSILPNTLPSDTLPEHVERVERGLSLDDLLRGIEVGVVDPYYAQDEDLRSLAIEATACFGWFRSGNSECRACPLASLCAEALLASLAGTSAALEASLSRQIREGERLPETPAEEAPSSSEDENLLSGLRSLTMPFQGVCSADCGSPISEGDVCYNIPGKGAFHRDCAIAALKGGSL